MPVFTFSGKDASGQKISGERNASSKQVLTQQLKRERIVPGSCSIVLPTEPICEE